MAKRSKCDQWYRDRGFAYFGTSKYLHEDGVEQTVDILTKLQPGKEPGDVGWDRNFYFCFMKPVRAGGRPINVGSELQPALRAARKFRKAEPKGTPWHDQTAEVDEEVA